MCLKIYREQIKKKKETYNKVTLNVYYFTINTSFNSNNVSFQSFFIKIVSLFKLIIIKTNENIINVDNVLTYSKIYHIIL